jgi:hypothetical protein
VAGGFGARGDDDAGQNHFPGEISGNYRYKIEKVSSDGLRLDAGFDRNQTTRTDKIRTDVFAKERPADISYV